MPDKWLLEQLAGTPPKFDGYSSYHLHKVLEEMEALVESQEAQVKAFYELHYSTPMIEEAAQILITRLSAWLLRRFRSQLDTQHERELIEDWKGAFDNE